MNRGELDQRASGWNGRPRQIKDLLGLSYDLTKAKSKRKGKHKMAKKIVVLSTSFRKEGNSAQLARQFAKGAQDAGHEVKEIYLSDYHMENCRGCFACQKTGKCVVQDNVGGILEEMRSADVLAFATPVYFYGMCGAMKTFWIGIPAISRRNMNFGIFTFWRPLERT